MAVEAVRFKDYRLVFLLSFALLPFLLSFPSLNAGKFKELDYKRVGWVYQYEV
jgi:hypothetical protein